ncbi:MAG TPA: TonB-dependent receptor [Longimicrobiales bacterium]
MRNYLVIGLLLTCAQTAHAQETQDTFALHQLVVSVARLPIERSAASAAVTVLGAAELRARGVRTVAEALRTVPGAAIAQGGAYGSFGSLFLRGGESDYVQVLIDGVRVNSPGEHFDFGSFTLEDVDRVEIVRGPVSVLYGSDAVTGIVQIFTRRGRAAHYGLAARAGTGQQIGANADGRFNVQSYDAHASGGDARVDYSIGASHFRSDGAYAFNNSNRNTGLTGRFGFAPDAATTLSATVRFSRNDLHYPTDGAGNLADYNQRDLTTGTAVGVEVARRFSRRIEARVLVSADRNDDRYHDAPDNAADTLGFYAGSSNERFQHEAVEVRVNYALTGRSTLTAGAEFEDQHERGWSRNESEFGPSEGSSRASRNNRALYGQLLTGTGRLNVQAGVRLDDNDRFGHFATYRGGVSLRVLDHWRVRASAGTSFKQPRFYEQFATGFVNGNPGLSPEESRSVDAGAEYLAAAWRLSASAFTQRFHNLIQYVASPDPGAANYTNLGAARARGIELEAERALGAISARASYTLLRTDVIDAGTGQDPLFLEGRTLLRRPRHSGSLSLSWTRDSGHASLTGQYVGGRDDLDFNNYPQRVTLRPYARIDASLEQRLGLTPMRASLAVENLLAADYQEMFNFPARRRMVFLGLRYER